MFFLSWPIFAALTTGLPAKLSFVHPKPTCLSYLANLVPKHTVEMRKGLLFGAMPMIPLPMGNIVVEWEEIDCPLVSHESMLRFLPCRLFGMT